MAAAVSPLPRSATPFLKPFGLPPSPGRTHGNALMRATASSSVSAPDLIGVNCATGLPRSVITTSLPARTSFKYFDGWFFMSRIEMCVAASLCSYITHNCSHVRPVDRTPGGTGLAARSVWPQTGYPKSCAIGNAGSTNGPSGSRRSDPCRDGNSRPNVRHEKPLFQPAREARMGCGSAGHPYFRRASGRHGVWVTTRGRRP